MSFTVRLAIFYSAIFLVIGSFLPFFPVWLDSKGLSASDIGVILSSPLLLRVLVTPVVSFAADRDGNRRRLVIGLASGASIASLALLSSSSFWAILVVTLVFALFWVSIMPLTETIAMAGVRVAGLDYGRMRLWGSFSFIAVSVTGGIAIGHVGADAALVMFIAATVCVLLAAFALPEPSGRGRLKAAIGQPGIRVRDVAALLRSKLFLLLLFTASTVQGAHALYYAFATLHWRSIGIPATAIGLLWATGVVAEIALFAVSRRVVDIVGPARLMIIAAVAAVVRWSVMAIDPPLAILFSIQLLHGLTFGAAHLGAIHAISRIIPEDHAATAQGLYASVTAGLAMGSGIAAAGPLYAFMGSKGFWVMAGIAAVSAVGAWVLSVRWVAGGPVSTQEKR